jgi:hypothetical protein
MSDQPKFGSLTPEEASRRGVEARQRKRAEQSPDLTPHQKIEAAMEKKAIGGDVNAAREYREWLKLNQAMQGGGENDDILSLLTGEQLDILRGWLHANEAVGYSGKGPPSAEDRRYSERKEREVNRIVAALRLHGFQAAENLPWKDWQEEPEEGWRWVAVRVPSPEPAVSPEPVSISSD